MIERREARVVMDAVATERAVSRVAHEEPPPPRAVNPRIPPDLEEQLLRGHSATFAALEASPSAGVVSGPGLLSGPAASAFGIASSAVLRGSVRQ